MFFGDEIFNAKVRQDSIQDPLLLISRSPHPPISLALSIRSSRPLRSSLRFVHGARFVYRARFVHRARTWHVVSFKGSRPHLTRRLKRPHLTRRLLDARSRKRPRGDFTFMARVLQFVRCGHASRILASVFVLTGRLLLRFKKWEHVEIK